MELLFEVYFQLCQVLEMGTKGCVIEVAGMGVPCLIVGPAVV